LVAVAALLVLAAVAFIALPMLNEQSESTQWRLNDAGLDKSVYHMGDKATAFIVVENVNGPVIHNLTATVNIAPKVGDDYPFSASESRTLTGLDIQPGNVKRIEYGAVVPDSLSGIPTVGEYRVTMMLRSDGVYLGGKVMYVKIEK
jgi:hypothetical protein